MKKLGLNEIINKAQKLDSYFITITTKEGEKLDHYTFQEKFNVDDIIPSLDVSLRSKQIKLDIPIPIIEPLPITEEKKPLNIFIFTHFNKAPEYYSPSRACNHLIKTLKSYGHNVVLCVQEGSSIDWDCEIRKIIPKFKREKNVVNEEAKLKLVDVLRDNLTVDFDVCITFDLAIEDAITYREALKDCGTPVKFLHFIRSGIGRPIDFNIPNSKLVYLNKTDVGRIAQRTGVSPDDIRVIFNEKDPVKMWDWHPVTQEISETMDLPNKDIIQIYPLCVTRMDSKGIDSVIKVFGELKKLGQKVCLVVCGANAKNRQEDIKTKMRYAFSLGLTEKDILFTSQLKGKFDLMRETPHKVVLELFQISNLFVFATVSEACSNVELEASMNKNLLVLNTDFPSLFDFTDKTAVLGHPFTSLASLHYSGRDSESINRLAKQIVGQIRSNKADRQFRHVWRTNNPKAIYENMIRPILYEGLNK